MKHFLAAFLILTSTAFADPKGDADAAEEAAVAAKNNALSAKQEALSAMGEAQMWDMMGGNDPAVDWAWRAFESHYLLGLSAEGTGDSQIMNGWTYYMQGWYVPAKERFDIAASAYGLAESAYNAAKGYAEIIISHYERR